jgi:hypothetical protein
MEAKRIQIRDPVRSDNVPIIAIIRALMRLFKSTIAPTLKNSYRTVSGGPASEQAELRAGSARRDSWLAEQVSAERP